MFIACGELGHGARQCSGCLVGWSLLGPQFLICGQSPRLQPLLPPLQKTLPPQLTPLPGLLSMEPTCSEQRRVSEGQSGFRLLSRPAKLPVCVRHRVPFHPTFFRRYRAPLFPIRSPPKCPMVPLGVQEQFRVTSHPVREEVRLQEEKGTWFTEHQALTGP